MRNYFKVGGCRFVFFENNPTEAREALGEAKAIARDMFGEVKEIAHFADPAGIELPERSICRKAVEAYDRQKAKCGCGGICLTCEFAKHDAKKARMVYGNSGESRLIGEGL